MSLQQVGSSESSSQLGCHIPSQLQTVSAGAHLSAPLQSVGEVAVSQHCCTVSTPLQLCLRYVSSAAFCQLSCNLSALAGLSSAVTDQLQDISSAMKCKILCNLSSQLQSVFSVMICQLGSSLSAQSVSSAATGVAQLRCVSAQLRCCQKAQLQLVNSAVRSAATCQLSCTLLAQMTLITSAAMC